MNLGDIDKHIQELDLPQEQKNAVLKLIDTKVDNEMKEVILEIRSLKNETEGLKKEMKTVLWVVGIALAIMTLVISIISFKK